MSSSSDLRARTRDARPGPRVLRRRLAGAAALLTAVALPATASPSPATALPVASSAAVGPAADTPAAAPVARKTRKPRRLRVMLAGDSMTHGRSGVTTYRYWLWREFGRQGVPVTFVGPYDGIGRPGEPGLYNRLDHGFETRHASRRGATFDLHLPLVRRWARQHRPDVVVLQLGFNDANRSSADQIVADTGSYLDRVWKVRPRTRFVLAEIPAGGKRRAARKNVVTAAANTMLAARYADEPRVTFSHLRTSTEPPWSIERHTYDRTHPNATGETLMAHRHAEALAEMGIFTRPVRVHHRETWRPPVRPAVQDAEYRGRTRALTRHRRVRLQLTEIARLVPDAPVRVRVIDRRGETVRQTPWTSRRTVAFRVPPGRYRIESELRLGRQRGRGERVTLRVR